MYGMRFKEMSRTNPPKTAVAVPSIAEINTLHPIFIEIKYPSTEKNAIAKAST